ncbi:MAG TPA: tyrosine-type recombinase/integrase [Dehalococcoidia bacterium]|nr:tyrosine-type recombinase/integrase [Dehalococcoidia bacterium]
MRTYLAIEEVERLEAAAMCLRDRLLIRLLAHLGCRISEALALTVDDIDLGKGMVTIQHLKLRIKAACPKCGARLSRTHTFCPGCCAKVEQVVAKEQEHRRVRTLPLDDDTIKLLKKYIKRGGPVTRNSRRLIFGINRHRAWQVVRDCADTAGLGDLVNPTTGKKQGISPHRLRDAFAVHAVKLDDSGDGLRLLQEHLGHTSFNTTARYRKVAGEEHREWYQKLWEKGEDGG